MTTLLPNRDDIIIPGEIRELERLLLRDWPRLTAQAVLEGELHRLGTAVLLETMHIDGQDYTFQQLRHFIEKAAGIGQEGAVGAGDYDAAQRAAGANMSVDVAAGDAWVKMDTGVRNGLYLQTNDATINVPVSAAHATLPRLDQLVIQINDSNVAGLSNLPELKILPGTPTSGATLDNRNGAAALGNDRLLLADILVPAAAASIVNANIRDRRKWARGAYAEITSTQGQLEIVTANLIASTDKRLEIGPNGKLRCSIAAPLRIDTVNAISQIEFRVDGVAAPRSIIAMEAERSAAPGTSFNLTGQITLAGIAAGSHVIGAYYTGVAGAYFNPGSAASTWVEYVEELRPTATND